jgi:hypothetical protein
MNYVLYVIGTFAVLTGLVGLNGVLLQWNFSVAGFFVPVVGYISAVLLLWGISTCGLASVIGLLKRIASQMVG